ncbi:ComEA family DNA-binding protein [Lawsonibacter sp. LCP25S3_G6]|uniref:ComEA family DNA-binding protein n=1 Tax=unclassified Lawsonibacter TaxID=2617946 RepID=UPI003F9A96A1
MAEVPTYEKVVAALTAGFVLFTGGWLWNQNRSHGEFRVTVMERREESGSSLIQLPQVEESWPDSLLPGEKIDLNTADEYELQRLPGIGEKRAADIIAYREANGPFETVEELDEVPGIGQGILDGLRDYAAVD